MLMLLMLPSSSDSGDDVMEPVDMYWSWEGIGNSWRTFTADAELLNFL